MQCQWYLCGDRNMLTSPLLVSLQMFFELPAFVTLLSSPSPLDPRGSRTASSPRFLPSPLPLAGFFPFLLTSQSGSNFFLLMARHRRLFFLFKWAFDLLLHWPIPYAFRSCMPLGLFSPPPLFAFFSFLDPAPRRVKFRHASRFTLDTYTLLAPRFGRYILSLLLVFFSFIRLFFLPEVEGEQKRESP